jgi:hypothetical protein
MALRYIYDLLHPWACIVTCSFSSHGYSSLWLALSDTRYFRARLLANPNGGGPSLQHVVDVADVLNQFITSSDSRVLQRHVDLAKARSHGKFPRVGKPG